MNFSSTNTISSKLPEFAGVSFTLRILNEPRRLKARLQVADINRRMRELREEAAEAVGTELTPEAIKTWGDREQKIFEPFGERTSLIYESEVLPVWTKLLLVSVNGLEIDGQPATIASFLEEGPGPLQRELAVIVGQEAGLTPREQGESAPPTTSKEPADGRPNVPDLEKAKSTAAPHAEDAETT